MRLVPCSCPTGPLDPAPLTALCGTSDAELPATDAVAYAGFWAADDGYYLCRTVGGVASWLAGRADGEGPAGAVPLARRSGVHAAVVPAVVPAAVPAAGHGAGRLRVMLVGRQHGRRRTRVPMHLCVRRLPPTSS